MVSLEVVDNKADKCHEMWFCLTLLCFLLTCQLLFMSFTIACPGSEMRVHLAQGIVICGSGFFTLEWDRDRLILREWDREWDREWEQIKFRELIRELTFACLRY
jgi:hypothetical protein